MKSAVSQNNVLGKRTIDVIAVAYQRFGELKVFVQSWINQTEKNWVLTVIHDGPSAEFEMIMATFEAQAPQRVFHKTTELRHKDYGHTLRDIGLKSVTGDYVLLTNADNYFIPKAVEFMNEALNQNDADVVIFNMIHSHNRPGGRNLPPYSYFESNYAPRSIDISAAIVKSELARMAGFRDKTHDGDVTYFGDIVNMKAPLPLSILKIPRVLLVHN